MAEKAGRDTAMVWHRAMFDVPAHGVIALYDRLISQWTSSFPPQLGDFRACWIDWETFWIDTNGERAEDVDEPVLLALLAGPVDAAHIPPGLRAARLQMARLNDGLTMICCGCLNQFGNPTPAVLPADGDAWCCETGICDFRLLEADAAKYRPPIRPQEDRPQVDKGNAAATTEYYHAKTARLAYTDIQLVAILREHGMVVEDERAVVGAGGRTEVVPPPAGAVPFATAVRFGRRMENVLLPHVWCRDVLRAMWVAWECKRQASPRGGGRGE